MVRGGCPFARANQSAQEPTPCQKKAQNAERNALARQNQYKPNQAFRAEPEEYDQYRDDEDYAEEGDDYGCGNYESVPVGGESASGGGVDFDYVEQELMKERRDVEIAQDLAQTRHDLSGIRSEPKDVQSLDPPEMLPQTVARFMHMEQRGLPTTAPPFRVVDFLFPGAKAPLSSVSAVVSPALGASVPVTNQYSNSPIPDKVKIDVATLEASVMASPDFKIAPSEPHDRNVVATPTRIGENIADITGVADVQRNRRDSLDLRIPTSVNVQLNAIGPAYSTRVQLRGSCVPWWFPGYYSAFPGSNGFDISRSPSATFAAAYNAVNPSSLHIDNQLKVETNSPADKINEHDHANMNMGAVH